MERNKELKTKEKQEVLKAEDFKDVGFTGFEQTSAETFKTPFLKILQILSPELNPKKPEHIPGAGIGQFCNTATKQLYGEVNVIVVRVEHNLLVWKPNRGGFAGAYPKSKEAEIVKTIQGLKKFDDEGNDVNDTISLFCINADDPIDIFILSLSTASLKYAKSWSTKMRMLKSNGKPLGVSFAGIWNIKTVEESNDKGDWCSIGNSPTFKRFITGDEFENVVKPAIELLKTAETDYTQMNDSQTEEKAEVEY